MARYDGRRTRHNKPTSDVNSQEYWENILRREGLSMSRGASKRLSYYAPGYLEQIYAARVSDGKAGAEPDPA